ncbi:MAG: NrfD/PsrC family molybdoenzyme membrane anchor subunit, partial [Eggerthella lenta]
MFSVLAVGYLFLGGAGAGAIAVASILDLAWVRAPFGHASRIGIGEATPLERTVAVGMLAGFAALALGMLFLLFDLGRIDRVASLLLRPSLSFLTVGTYALAGLAACAALLVAVRFAYLPSVPRGAVRAVEAAAAVVAVVVMLYT